MISEPKKILVVDDEIGLTRMLKLSLEKGGQFRILEVNTPSHAQDAARSFRPDLILMDVMMPEIDGGTLAAQIKEDPQLKHVPIVFLTAAVKKTEVDSAKGTIGGLPFVAKPIDLKQLSTCINRYL